MKLDAALGAWERACVRAGALRFVDLNLRAAGQVMFQDNPLSGLLFLAAIAWAAIDAGTPAILAGTLLGLAAATLTAIWLRADASNLAAGLYGYNGALVGLALPIFLQPSPLLWACVLLGAAASVVGTIWTAAVTRNWGGAALTFPFVLTTWVLLLAGRAFAGLGSQALPPPGPTGAAPTLPLAAADIVVAVLRSVSQVFFLDDTVAALLLLAGLVLGSPAAAALALAGALLAVLAAMAMGADGGLIRAGLMGFSPVLTAVALGSVFYAPSARVLAYAAVGTLFTVVLQGAMNAALAPLGIPTLTAPFIFATWLFLLPRRHVAGIVEPADAP